MSARCARYVLAFVATCALAYIAPVAAADDCGPMWDALMKLAQTPNHSFTDSSGAIAGGQSKASERIATATANYLQVRGKWLRSSMSPKQALQMQQDAMKDKKNGSCKYERDEAVEGEPAALYTTHNQDDGGVSDAQIWISKKRGLPLKQVVHLSVGGGKTGESQMATRYVYENVRAPDGMS
jgi:hypothetical protein